MYDTLIISKRLLPLNAEQQKYVPDNQDWQTKDLDCRLTKAYITDEGELKIDRTPDGFLYSELGVEYPDNYKPIERKLETIDHHGYITFYSDVNGEWFEFRAKFTDGKLVAIERR